MKRQSWFFVFGTRCIKLLAGMTTKKKVSKADSYWAKKYIGCWQFNNPKQKTTHQLKIKEDFRLSIDGQLVKGTLEELSPKQLVWQDEFGFHLKVLAGNLQPQELYDEADDISYTLVLENKN